MNVRVVSFNESHDLESFVSGNTELGDWLRRHAPNATGQVGAGRVQG